MLAIFAAAPELCQLIKDVEADYERFLQHPGRRPKGPYAEVLPFLAEQAQDWESCATATSAGSSSPAVCPLVALLSQIMAYAHVLLSICQQGRRIVHAPSKELLCYLSVVSWHSCVSMAFKFYTDELCSCIHRPASHLNFLSSVGCYAEPKPCWQVKLPWMLTGHAAPAHVLWGRGRRSVQSARGAPRRHRRLQQLSAGTGEALPCRLCLPVRLCQHNMAAQAAFSP